MEACLPISPASLAHGDADASSFVVFSSWSDEQQQEGFECLQQFEPKVGEHHASSVASDCDNADPSEEHWERPQKRKKRLLLKALDRFFARGKKHGDEKVCKNKNGPDDASLASTAAETMCSTLCSELDDSTTIRIVSMYDDEVSLMSEDESSCEDENVPLMQARLFQTDIVKSASDFEFVTDYVSKEVSHLYSEEEKKSNQEDNKVSHVKTGIWQVTCFDNNGNAKEPFYVVTGVSMSDRVDMKKLKRAVFADMSYKRKPKISMAPTEIAQHLTGYQSGTMAPICHTVNMKLFLEASIVTGKEQDSDHSILCGSGMFGKCLSISVDAFLQVAKLNPKGMEICDIIQTKSKKAKGLPTK